MSTKDDIQTSINNRLKSIPTKIEGSTIQDVVGSVSYELANIIDTRINVILDNAFVTSADEEHLKIKGEELGIYKKEATSAYVRVQITNATPNTIVKKDIKAKTKDNIIFQVDKEVQTDENGFAEFRMQCLEKGNVGNIKTGELCEFYSIYEGFESAEIINIADGYDGFEDENTEEYRQRILEYLKDDACNSNIADYTNWAKSVPGVKHVVVKDATVSKAGHVDVYISALENENVTDNLIQNVKEYIEKEQIINAILNVYPLQYFKINVNAKIKTEEYSSIANIKYHFEELLKNYLDNKPLNVSYLYVSNLLFEAKGVLDIFDITINGTKSTVELDNLQVPVIGDVVLTQEGE